MESSASMTPKSSQADVRSITIPKPNNMFNIEYVGSLEFFKWWCTILRPFVPLTEREIDVVSSFLKQRWELSKSTTDPAALDILLMSDDTKQKVVQECNISFEHFYVVMSSLRKKRVIVNNIIAPQLIPNKRDWDNGIFRLLIQFKEKQS